MNKENFSWIHYAYITITASVLAYVTYADNGTEESTSALDMLPNNTLLNESQNSPVDIPVATEVTDNSPEIEVAPEAEVATAPEAEVVTTPEAEVATAPEAEVVTTPEVEVAIESKTNNVNGGKLKNTRTNNKKHKKKQTRNRR